MLRSPKLDASARWRLLATCMVALAAAFVFSAATPDADAQGNFMTVSSDTTYRVDVANDRVFVEATYRLQNNIEPFDLGDGRTRNTYFTHYNVAIPHSVAEFSARVDGLLIQTNFVESDDYDLAETWFPQDLRYGDMVTMTVSYVIPDSGPRAGWGHAEISEEYVELTIWAQGSPGRASVSVVLPGGYTVDLVGGLDAFTQSSRNGQTVLNASGISDAGEFYGQVLAYNENISPENTSLAIHSGTAVVLSRPSDTQWRDFVIDTLQNDLPVLEDLIGIPWPHANVVVEQSNEPRRDGFGGWYDSSDNTIKFESANREVLLHELTHGWFNSRFSLDRWINEGLAEEFASRTIEARSGLRPDPTWPDPLDSSRVMLSDWVRPNQVTTESQRRTERYHYNASWWVMRQITNDIGMDEFSDVMVALDDVGRRENRDWRTLYEILDATSVDDQTLDGLFSTYVTTTSLDTFQQRRAVLARYDDAFGDSGFDAPFFLREQMRTWEWGQALPFLDEFADFVPLMADFQQRAAESNIDIAYHERLFVTAHDAADFERLGNYLAADTATMNEIDANRIQVLEDADVHNLKVAFAVTTVGIAERHVDTARAGIADVVAGRAALTEAAEQANILLQFQPDATLDNALLEIAGLQMRLDRHIEQQTAANDRMQQLGLDIPVATDPVLLQTAHRRVAEQMSTVRALASAKPALRHIDESQRSELSNKRSAAAVLQVRDAVEGVLADRAGLDAIEPAEPPVVATTSTTASGRNPIVPALFSVVVLLLGVVATVAFRNAKESSARQRNAPDSAADARAPSAPTTAAITHRPPTQ